MLDVVLYRIDRRGLLRLSEGHFKSLRELGSFFASDAADPWDWAEVAMPGRPRLARFSADDLRAIACSAPTILLHGAECGC